MPFYQIKYSDGSFLTFEASGQPEALRVAANHSDSGEEFTLKSRRKPTSPPWILVGPNCTSYWEVNYLDKSAPCRRVR